MPPSSALVSSSKPPRREHRRSLCLGHGRPNPPPAAPRKKLQIAALATPYHTLLATIPNHTTLATIPQTVRYVGTGTAGATRVHTLQVQRYVGFQVQPQYSMQILLRAKFTCMCTFMHSKGILELQ